MSSGLLISTGFSIAVLLGSIGQAMAGTACYEDQLLEPAISCGGNSGQSADFSGKCKATEAQWAKVEVACPAKWVNIKNDTETQKQTCARVGLKPANLAGTICASGERRPSVGLEWESISYKYGSWGGLDVLGGDTVRGGGAASYCYMSSDKKDNDSTDRLVAFMCGP